ncbi:MAG: GPO family capsid scaffolding protein [Georgfuchsia sp.]
MSLSKSFVIATEGPTIDGRNISRDWIKQMAASYDPKVYTAVANLEHYLSSVPESTFSAYGKVVALGTQEAVLMGEKKLQLTAVVDVNDQIIALQKAGKKAFSSMEVTANFIGKGIAYLTGLAFTDSPASLGTEAMKFSAVGKGEKDSIYSFNEAIEIEFEKEADDKPGLGASLFAKVKELLGKKAKTDDERYADVGEAVTAVAESQKVLLDNYNEFQKSFAALNATVKDQAAYTEADRKAFAELKQTLDGTEKDPKRPSSPGGNGAQVTDC